MPFNAAITYQGTTGADDAGTVNFFNSFRFQYGTAANRPAFGNQGIFYYATDTKIFSYDTGAAWVDLSVVVGSTGTYTGDDTVNRAIAHGLGATPKMVVIIDSTGAILVHIFGAAAVLNYQHGSAGTGLAVTIPDSTNFYVGNATAYPGSGNGVGYTYYWVAYK